MLLTSTSDIVTLATSSSSGIDIHSVWNDITTTTFSPNRTNIKISSVTTATIVDHPASSTQRQIKSIIFRNVGAANNTCGVYHTDGTHNECVFTCQLLPGESSVYDGKMWICFNSIGIPFMGGSSKFSDAQSFLTPGANIWVAPTIFTPKFVKVIMWGGGGGAGMSASQSASYNTLGGTGGGGGGYAERTFYAADFGAIQNLYVARGGYGAKDINVAAYTFRGSTGENSTFGTPVRLTAYGGGGGCSTFFSTSSYYPVGGGGAGCFGAGNDSDGTAYSGRAGAPVGAIPYVGGMGTPGSNSATTNNTQFGGGGGAGTAGINGYDAGSSLWGGGGGGAGGGCTTIPQLANSSAGGSSNSYTSGGGGTAGTNGAIPTAGGNGSDGNSLSGGDGGGGGGGSITAGKTGGAGGNGGRGGGGGGGSGSGPSGAGTAGNGGGGMIYVFSW